MGAGVSDDPLDPELDPEEPLEPDEPEDDPLEDESELPEEEEEEPLDPEDVVLDDESHFGAASESGLGVDCSDSSFACFGGPPQAASASPMATMPIFFEVRMPNGLARFQGGQHST